MTDPQPDNPHRTDGLGLGIDAGGTQTRWALAAPGGAVVAEGTVAGLSALQMGSAHGREAVRATFAELAGAVLVHGVPARVEAGLTGFGGDSELLQRWLAELLHVRPDAVRLRSDMEIAYRASFAPGQGYLVYAGTGSIGAFIDAHGTFHRAGGRGVVLDDGGGGFWIAREALRHIWRLEDERPGAWQESPMARAVFDYVGGADWACSRQFIYGQERGAIGKLALAVAAAADQDPAAAVILRAAGAELARLARALLNRFGPRPVAVAGRATQLHPMIVEAMRAALPGVDLSADGAHGAHHAAARMALTPSTTIPANP
ncbi:BadF/BadG/BcrA/BcrD ATPase family protein [uncultured Massilia sp.]|uniref:BadF/BadG/BcrA/BcrD ATPase family protein n=1 Tax=uncultured Massilia sp. TaxID=169973 RepID=UPI0025F1BB8C|nr:BadF/BadG/BcrA/BcrD ATPase family protein [uncultured Massilia sp.]